MKFKLSVIVCKDEELVVEGTRDDVIKEFRSHQTLWYKDAIGEEDDSGDMITHETIQKRIDHEVEELNANDIAYFWNTEGLQDEMEEDELEFAKIEQID